MQSVSLNKDFDSLNSKSNDHPIVASLTKQRYNFKNNLTLYCICLDKYFRLQRKLAIQITNSILYSQFSKIVSLSSRYTATRFWFASIGTYTFNHCYCDVDCLLLFDLKIHSRGLSWFQDNQFKKNILALICLPPFLALLGG